MFMNLQTCFQKKFVHKHTGKFLESISPNIVIRFHEKVPLDLQVLFKENVSIDIQVHF